MCFSALSRSVGIPARTTGRWQRFKGNFSGHFCAAFYLLHYGWVPAEPTAADIVDYLADVSDQDKKSFRDFFFGNQDYFRCNVQKDVMWKMFRLMTAFDTRPEDVDALLAALRRQGPVRVNVP